MTSISSEFKQFPPYFGEDRKRCLTEEEMEQVFKNCKGLVNVHNGGGYIKISEMIYTGEDYRFQSYKLFEMEDYLLLNEEWLATGKEPMEFSDFLAELMICAKTTDLTHENGMIFEQFLEEIKYDFPNLVLYQADEIPVFEFNEGLEQAIKIKNEVIYFKY